ncbi:hypothetical protein AGMMS49938_15940 [Fibrobacterales bacterium]|nr:hypothetical protein AGMMS49938_15940 [Fibrobacterales bacterium]
MAKKKNISESYLKNITQLDKEFDFEDYSHKKDFFLLCKLIPNPEEEKLDIEIIDKEKFDCSGLVYIMVIKGKIFKIGHTINTIKNRVQSYNCGKLKFRLSGTASTTNFYVLQSLLALNSEVFIYAFITPTPEYKLWGETYKDSFPVPKRAENILIKEYIGRYGRKPIGCTQT